MTDAAREAAKVPPVAQADAGSLSLGRAAGSGLRQPIVAILLLIALFTAVSGKPLDGFLMLAVATLLIFDAARSRRQAALGGSGANASVAASATPPVTGHRHFSSPCAIC